MARKVPGGAPGGVRTFVPEAFGNRADPHPIEIGLRIPTERERRAAMPILRRAIAELGASPEQLMDDEGLVRLVFGFVVAVGNYENGAGDPILTGPDLEEHGEFQIRSELVMEVIGSLTPMKEEEKKLSEKRSTSSATVTPASNGTAAPAAPEASTAPAVAV